MSVEACRRSGPIAAQVPPAVEGAAALPAMAKAWALHQVGVVAAVAFGLPAPQQ
jgi:hypothetical protein